MRGGSADGGRDRFGGATAEAEAEWLLPAEWPLREGPAGEAFAGEAFGLAWEALGLLGEALAEGFPVPGAEGPAAECPSLGRPVGGFCSGRSWTGGSDSVRPGGVRPLPGWLPACASPAEAEAGVEVEVEAGAGAEVGARVGAGSAAYA
ncbi:hypothetical protein CG723_29225 [Streptomyces sp. CB01635]|nr:hypothetical protein CG723_29225 [Streptomyces sp. CB01635]